MRMLIVVYMHGAVQILGTEMSKASRKSLAS